MSDLFSVYEDKFNSLIKQIQDITSSFTTLSKDKAESALSVIVNLFKEADGVFHQMEIETSANGTLMSLNKVKQYKTEYSALQCKFQTIQDKYITQKAENAIILGTEDDNTNSNNNNNNYGIGDSSRQKQFGLIANENGNEDCIVGVSNSFDLNKGDGNDNNRLDKRKIESFDIQDDDVNFNMINEKRNKKILIVSSIIIVVILIFLILLFSLL